MEQTKCKLKDCKKPFIQKAYWQKFCCDACKQKAYRARVEKKNKTNTHIRSRD